MALNMGVSRLLQNNSPMIALNERVSRTCIIVAAAELGKIAKVDLQNSILMSGGCQNDYVLQSFLDSNISRK
jgi:hypothetical protein